MALLLPPVFADRRAGLRGARHGLHRLTSNIEHFNILFTGILTPMFLFGGDLLPVLRTCPGGPRCVGWCLPLSHLVAATRDLTLGGAGLGDPRPRRRSSSALLALLFPFPAARLRRTLLR